MLLFKTHLQALAPFNFVKVISVRIGLAQKFRCKLTRKILETFEIAKFWNQELQSGDRKNQNAFASELFFRISTIIRNFRRKTINHGFYGKRFLIRTIQYFTIFLRSLKRTDLERWMWGMEPFFSWRLKFPFEDGSRARPKSFS